MIAIAFVGDGLRDALDPQSNRSASRKRTVVP